MSSDEVRVRIAPSPTGYFHVGTARTAIYNWLFAKKHNGKFLLRIEDTNEELSKKDYIDIILEGLKWMGFDWDEEIVYQSKRIDSYVPYAKRLLAEGKAYRCFCTPEEINEQRQKAQKEKRNYKYSKKCRYLAEDEIKKNLSSGKSYTIRLKLPLKGEAAFHDSVYGEVKRSYADLDDMVIMKSNGHALYNFAVVIDDHDMRISHVIRGNDHIMNTFYQSEIYKAFGWKAPEFAHLPLILRPDRAKLSKRKGDKGVTEYQAEGYLSDAMVNYLALVGWSPKDDREKMSRDELIEAFSLDGINPNNAIFDVDKLTWMNGEYIRELDSNKLIDMVSPHLIEAGLTTKYWIETNWHWTVKVINALKERCKLLSDFERQSHYFFKSDFDYDSKGVKKHFGPDDTVELLRAAKDSFEAVGKWDKESLEKVLRDLAEKKGIKAARLIHPIRLAISGVTAGPGLFDILELLGEKEVQTRIERAIKYIEKCKFPEQEGK